VSDVFVSYKREDRARVKPLVDALTAEGLSVWWDVGIEGGAAWRQSIQTALDRAGCVIVVWSAASVGPQGEFIHDEASLAKTRNIYLPITIDDVSPPLGFGQVQSLDLIGWHGRRTDKRFQAVVAAVRIMATAPAIGIGIAAPPGASQSSRWPRRAIAGAFLLMLLGGGMSWWMLKGPIGLNAPTGIAILPFEAALGDATTRAFADGVAETVAGVMAKAELPTLSPDITHAASPAERDAVAVRAGAAYVLGGRVEREGQNLLVTVNVSDPRKHEILWSTRFTRAASEAAPMQDQVATTTARVLQCAFDIIRFPDSRFDQETVALYLRACEVRADWDAQDQERDLLRKVVKRQPRFAMGWAKLAIASGMAIEDLPPDQARAAKAEATADAARAMRLDPRNGLPYFALAYLIPTPGHLWQRHSLLMKGLALSPDNGIMNFKEGEVLGEAGRTQDALAYYRRAVSLDPLNPSMRFELGVALSSTHTEEARSVLDQAISIWPDEPHLRLARIALEARYGDPDRALALIADPTTRPASWEAEQIEDWRRFPQVRKSHDPATLAAYERDELAKLAAGKTYVSAVVLRLSGLGDVDGAFAAAARATPDDPLDTEPLFRPAAVGVRKDPRFMPLAIKTGLVDFWRRTGKWADFCDAPDRPYDCRAEAAKLTGPPKP